jgi:gamma-glutamylputrescine oxidase
MERLKSPAYHGALWESAAGHFHPLNYALGLAGAAEAAGVQIFERSPVERVATGPRPAAYTAEGVVRAKHMVLAGNAYLGPVSRPLYRRIMPVASYVLATEPLGEDGALAAMPGDDAVSDTNFIVNYFRLSEDKRMLFGGRASYTQIRPRDLFAYMRPRMAEIFPQLADARLDYCWEGNIGVTMDRMPDIGRLDGEVWYAQGYSGHGVALSGMYGKLIAEAIAGQAERFDLMARFRHPPFPGGKLRTPLLALAMMWYRLRDALS